jgi:hypothetical protein
VCCRVLETGTGSEISHGRGHSDMHCPRVHVPSARVRVIHRYVAMTTGLANSW